MKFDSRKDQRRLADWIARYVNENEELSRRGLWLSVQEIEVRGRPPEHVRLWGTLHFLSLGNPFLCPQVAHTWFILPPIREELDEAVREHLHLRNPIRVEFVAVNTAASDDIRFDLWQLRTTVPADIDERDELGRTAILRAAMRGFERQVEELLAAGADIRIPDRDGNTLEKLSAADRLDEEIAILIALHRSKSQSGKS